MTHVGSVLPTYDGVACEVLQARSGAARVLALQSCSSTMDVAHAVAGDGAPHATVVVAESQDAGRGRSGKSWSSARGAGVWASVLVRQPASAPTGVLSLRVGIALADALDRYAPAPTQLKWPNDLMLHGRKLAGVLTEARWRGAQLEWIVVGVGVNLRDAGTELPAATLGAGVAPAMVLVDIVSAVLAAGAIEGALSPGELATFERRDFALGRTVTAPLPGVVVGIDSGGGLRVRTAGGERVAVSGSLIFSPSLTEQRDAAGL
jgi:BirA family transcriptional regulator, biotin operon repressor / biotin---[acetyl-CoA-carboxylase] ligase